MRIDIDLSKKTLLVRKGDNEGSKDFEEILLEADIVSGCDGNNTPTGEFLAGKFIKDKTNPKYGVVPWSKDPWGNPYGPYFLQILSLKGVYTTYGIYMAPVDLVVSLVRLKNLPYHNGCWESL